MIATIKTALLAVSAILTLALIATDPRADKKMAELQHRESERVRKLLLH